MNCRSNSKFNLMEKTKILLVIFLFPALAALSQTKPGAPAMDATFCGKVGEGGATGGTYTVKELQDCDFEIIPLDPNLTVTEFKMSLVAKDKSFSYLEKQITGNVIPEEYRNQILTHTKNIFLEYIKAANKNGVLVLIKPIAIRL
jgi:hypothetical protein